MMGHFYDLPRVAVADYSRSHGLLGPLRLRQDHPLYNKVRFAVVGDSFVDLRRNEYPAVNIPSTDKFVTRDKGQIYFSNASSSSSSLRYKNKIPSGPFTLLFSAVSTGSGGYPYIITTKNAHWEETNGFQLVQFSTDKTGFQYRGSGSSRWEITGLTSLALPNISRAFTHDASNSVRYFENGKFITSSTVTVPTSVAMPVNLSSNGYSPILGWTGYIAYLYVIDYLPDAVITALMRDPYQLVEPVIPLSVFISSGGAPGLSIPIAAYHYNHNLKK